MTERLAVSRGPQYRTMTAYLCLPSALEGNLSPAPPRVARPCQFSVLAHPSSLPWSWWWSQHSHPAASPPAFGPPLPTLIPALGLCTCCFLRYEALVGKPPTSASPYGSPLITSPFLHSPSSSVGLCRFVHTPPEYDLSGTFYHIHSVYNSGRHMSGIKKNIRENPTRSPNAAEKMSESDSDLQLEITGEGFPLSFHPWGWAG